MTSQAERKTYQEDGSLPPPRTRRPPGAPIPPTIRCILPELRGNRRPQASTEGCVFSTARKRCKTAQILPHEPQTPYIPSHPHDAGQRSRRRELQARSSPSQHRGASRAGSDDVLAGSDVSRAPAAAPNRKERRRVWASLSCDVIRDFRLAFPSLSLRKLVWRTTMGLHRSSSKLTTRAAPEWRSRMDSVFSEGRLPPGPATW